VNLGPLTQTLTCEYCHTTQQIGIVWTCAKCQAPLRPHETPHNWLRGILAPLPQFAYPVIDFSKWQGVVNFGQLQASNAIKSIVKASQSTNPDSRYAANMIGLLEYLLSFDLYHYVDPTYPSTAAAQYFAAQVNALTSGWLQFDAFTLITPYGAKFRVWMDVEDNIGPGDVPLSREGMTAYALNFKNVFESLTRIKLGCYTRASFWDVALTRTTWAATMPLWDAQYNLNIQAPTIPMDWLNAGKTWQLWQVDDKGLGVDGSYWGMQSHGMDVSYINLPQEQAYSYAWARNPAPPEPPVYDYWVRVNTNKINVRTEPTDGGGNTTVCATSLYNQRLHVIDERTDAQGRTWVKLEAWAAKWLTKQD